MKMLRSGFFLFLAATLVLFSLAACGKPEEKEAKYVSRGDLLFEKGAFEKAALEYKNALRINPASAEARYKLGLVAESQNDLRNAFESFKAAEQQNGAYHPAVLKVAQYFLVAGQPDEAQKRLDAVLAADPESAKAHALKAALAFQRKQFDEAEKEVQASLAKDPGNVTALSVLINVYRERNETEKAAALIEKSMEMNPKEISFPLMKVMLYEKSGELGKLTEAFQALFRLKPDVARFRSDLAEFYLKAGKTDEAEKVLREGVESRPANKDMKRALIEFLDKTKGLEAAEAEVRKIAQANPSDDSYVFWLADLYIKHKDIPRAMALLEEMIADDRPSAPSALNARTSLANIHFAKGDKNLARNLVNAVLEKAPDNPTALLLRSRLFFEEGAYQSAVADLRSILRDNPKAAQALQLLAETLLMQGHLDLAVDTLSQMVGLEPNNVQAQVRLAQFYGLRGETDRAFKILKFVNETQPDFAVGWESAARIAIGIKDWTKARAAILKLEPLPGQRPTALYLKGQIASQIDQPDEAAALYKEAVLADPHAPLAEYALTALVSEAPDPARIKAAIAFMESLPSPDALTFTLMGEGQLRLSEWDKAAELFDKAIAMKPSFQAPYLHRARLWMRENKPEQALKVLQEAEGAAPSDLRALMLASDIRSQIGKYKEAIQGYETIIARNPRADFAANNLAQLIADYQSDDKAALERARLIAERFIGSTDPFLLDTLAWVYFRQGKTSQAQTIMERVMSLSDKLPPQIHYHYGALLLNQGKTAEAKEHLKKALDAKMPYAGLEEAKKLLEKAESL